jgi:Ca2+/Na+ antiporter
MFGIIVLAIATTLPEKFIAVMSGFRGHVGILVANTVGSNIFLLSLCMGIIMVDTEGRFDAGNVNATELGVMWGATAASTVTIWFGAKWSRVIGGLMLTSYIVFLVLEFTVIRKL